MIHTYTLYIKTYIYIYILTDCFSNKSHNFFLFSFKMNLFSRKSVVPPPSPTPIPSNSNNATAGPEAFASNSAYGRGFFEPGAYEVALKRCENGHDLAQQLS